MDLCHSHNLSRDLATPKPYGIRVSIRSTDSFARLLGASWERLHWFESEQERDRTLADMASEHLYSRQGDRPTLIYEAVEREVS